MTIAEAREALGKIVALKWPAIHGEGSLIVGKLISIADTPTITLRDAEDEDHHLTLVAVGDFIVGHSQKALENRVARVFEYPPNPPVKAVLDTASNIRLRFGHGSANFPGAVELYTAAEKIEAWAAEHEERATQKPQEAAGA